MTRTQPKLLRVTKKVTVRPTKRFEARKHFVEYVPGEKPIPWFGRIDIAFRKQFLEGQGVVEIIHTELVLKVSKFERALLDSVLFDHAGGFEGTVPLGALYEFLKIADEDYYLCHAVSLDSRNTVITAHRSDDGRFWYISAENSAYSKPRSPKYSFLSVT